LNSVTDIWENVLRQLRGTLSETTIATWFDELRIVDIRGNTCYLHCASDFKRGYLESLFLNNIKASLRDIFSVDFEVKILDDAGLLELQGGPAPRRQADRFTYAEFTFENFVVGPSNKLAHAAACKVAESPGESYNPLFIHGESGLGKTHLLYAIAHTIHLNHPGYKIIYIKGDTFTNELVAAIREGRNQEFREKYRGADVFLMDDVQFIAGRDSTQEEMFHTFNTLYEQHKQIVFTADRPPKEMLRLEDRLKTRFEWGLIADIQPPDFETRIAIIKRKAELLDLDIPNDVAEYIANRLKNNIRQLEGVVKKLKAYKLLAQTPPSIIIAQNAIRDILNDNQPIPVTVERIISEVGRTFGVSSADIRSSKRSSQISNARQIAIYVIREITQMSMASIGEEFGGRDHSTIVYAINQVTKNMKHDTQYKETIEDIIKNIRDN